MKTLNQSYRLKLILVYCVTIVMVAAVISVAQIFTTARQMTNDKKAHLHLLTDQVLTNFVSETEAVSQQLISMVGSTGTAEQMYAMRGMDEASTGYYHASRTLINDINQMINAQTDYDAVYARLDQGAAYTNVFASAGFIAAAAELMNDQRLGVNTHGRTQWVRGEDGQVYVLRDIYNQSPFRHIGKLAARVRKERLGSLGGDNAELRCAIVFLNNEGKAIALSGEVKEGMDEAAEQLLLSGGDELVAGQRYYASVKRDEKWTAVGLLPEAALFNVQRTVATTGMLIGLLGAVLGSLAVLATTHGMTRQINLLVTSMDEVAAGNMDLKVPVESRDEIGKLATHFNTMIDRTRALLAQVVREEGRKNKAEYEMLEYKYRSLQSQINPHFIYNAMETVNALAKIDGNDEICEVVRHISAFFRQNTCNMQKRFITVNQEFDSLKQYAYIYRHIHGESLSTPFFCDRDAGWALIPTMILQPVLENALVHGVRSNDAVVDIAAAVEGERLTIRVKDNGEGMPQARVEQILHGTVSQDPENARPSAGIGMRNVRDRLRLIYGDEAAFSIESRLGEGTAVSITIPLIYDESELKPKGAFSGEEG